MDKLPIDYLPIVRPLEDTSPVPDDMWFYENVVIKLLPDIIRLEATGIPINLGKVKKVEETVNNVLVDVETTLANNPLVQKYLEERYNTKAETTIKQLESKTRTVEDFLKPFDIKNKIHRTYVVNTYLYNINKEDMVLEEWSKKDLKKLNQIIASKFISDLLANEIKDYMQPIISLAMKTLAKDKAETFNKNRIEARKERLLKEKNSVKFNPSSPQQKQQFFEMLGVEAENTTKAGSPQWDRKALESLNKLLSMMIEEGETNVSA